MLVLTRKAGEGIVIGDDIRVTVIELKGGGVRIGIEAPRSTKVHRLEVYERIIQENREATQWGIDDLDVLSQSLRPEKKS